MALTNHHYAKFEALFVMYHCCQKDAHHCQLKFYEINFLLPLILFNSASLIHC